MMRAVLLALALALPASGAMARQQLPPGQGAAGALQPATVTGLVKSTGTAFSAAAISDLTGLGAAPAASPTFTGTITGGVGGLVLGTGSTLNYLANVTSPILGPEAGNNPPPSTSSYIGSPLIVGFSASANAGTGSYASTSTANLTVTGTTGNHWGREETAINVSGGGLMTSELNDKKSLVTVAAGTTVTGENLESAASNFGTMTQWSSYIANPTNISGTITYGIGFSSQPGNISATASSFGRYTGFSCSPIVGGGSAVPSGFNACLYNNDPTAVISTQGHYGTNTGGGANPAVSACGGGSPAIDSRATDVMGTVTEGTSATGCTVTFVNAYPFAAPHCQVTSPNGAPFTGYSISTTQLAITNASASGNQYTYQCFASY